MKKIQIVITVICCFFVCAFSVQGGIKGTIINGTPGDTISLVDPFKRQAPALEKTILGKKGSFEFKYTPENIGFYYITFSNGQSILVVLKPGNSGQIDVNFSTGVIEKVVDSKENALLKSFQEMNTGFAGRQQVIDQETNKTNEQKQSEKQLIEKEKLQAIGKLLLANANNYASAALVEYLPADEFVTVHDSVLSTLIKLYPENYIVKAKYQEIEVKKKLALGYPAPEITLQDTAGKLFSLSSLRGKVVLIDFWASWCRPCRVENPNMVKLYQNYKQYGFDILGVSLDQSKDNWVGAIEKDGLIWNHVSDLKGWQSAAGAAYGVRSIPFTVLVDKKGNIIAKGLRGQALEEKIREVLLQQ
jgi:peroxiredoxin